MIAALQVVAMMASEIVKAHQITEKQRDDAIGIIRNYSSPGNDDLFALSLS